MKGGASANIDASICNSSSTTSHDETSAPAFTTGGYSEDLAREFSENDNHKYGGRVRKCFTQSDNFKINKHLSRYIKNDIPINKKDFEMVLKSIPPLKEIFEKFGLKSLITKIRTERKSR